MPVQICFESYAAFAQAFESLLFFAFGAGQQAQPLVRGARVPNFDQLVRAAAANLPYKQARAVWFVDRCGYSYADAAAAMRLSEPALAALVAEARRGIREDLYAQFQAFVADDEKQRCGTAEQYRISNEWSLGELNS